MSEYDDDNYDDGFNEEELAKRIQIGLWKKLFTYTRPYRKQIGYLAFFAVLTATADVAYPLITKGVIDAVAEHGTKAELMPFAYYYLICTLVLSLSVGGFIWMGGKIRTHVSHDIRRDGFENLQRLSFSYYDHRPVGWLMARMTSDCERLSNILAWGVLDLVWGLSLMAGIAVVMMIMNFKLALLILAIIPLLAWVSVNFKRRILTSAREVRRTNSRITGAYNEAIMGVQTSKTYVREAENLVDFQKLTLGMNEASVTNLTQSAIYVPIVLTLASLATGMALAVGGFDMLDGAMTAGMLIAFLAYTRHFFEPIEELGHWFAEMQMAQASAERIISLIETDPDIADSDQVVRNLRRQEQSKTNAQVASRLQARNVAADGGVDTISNIELKNVSFSYGDGHPVLQQINLSAKRGETIAIVGPTGGGKSTLVNIISRFYEPVQGQVLIDGVDYRERSLHWLQSNLGMVLQNAHVFSGSIMENIRYGKLSASDADVLAAAKTSGAHELILTLPDTYQTEVGEGGGKLSAGQKQLVSFARAILADPGILIMDEATSSIDTETERRIQLGLQTLLAGRISFVIAHRLSTIRNATRILVVNDGRIVEQGSHAQLLALKKHYYKLYTQQSISQSSRSIGSTQSELA